MQYLVLEHPCDTLTPPRLVLGPYRVLYLWHSAQGMRYCTGGETDICWVSNAGNVCTMWSMLMEDGSQRQALLAFRSATLYTPHTTHYNAHRSYLLPWHQPLVKGVAQLAIATFTYKNWRGEVARRRVCLLRLWRGSTEYHREKQLLLDAIDMDKGGERTFAVYDIEPGTLQLEP
jgi:hypothetical protein